MSFVFSAVFFVGAAQALLWALVRPEELRGIYSGKRQVPCGVLRDVSSACSPLTFDGCPFSQPV